MRQGALTEYLEYETSWHYDTGIYHRIGENFDTRFVVYYTDVSDYVALDRDKYYHDGKETAYAYNVDWVRFYGVEFEFNSTFNKLNIFGNYTYQDNKVDETGLPTSFWMDIPPKHKANLGLRYQLKDNILLTCDERYVGERKSERGCYTLDDFITTDLGIQYTFLENKAKVLAYVNNVFGENYQEVYGYPMPGQTFGVQLKYTFF